MRSTRFGGMAALTNNLLWRTKSSRVGPDPKSGSASVQPLELITHQGFWVSKFKMISCNLFIWGTPFQDLLQSICVPINMAIPNFRVRPTTFLGCIHHFVLKIPGSKLRMDVHILPGSGGDIVASRSACTLRAANARWSSAERHARLCESWLHFRCMVVSGNCAWPSCLGVSKRRPIVANHLIVCVHLGLQNPLWSAWWHTADII